MHERIGVVGAGTMGRGIAQVAATAGHEVILFDTDDAAVNSARDFLLRIFNRLAEKGRMTDADAKAIFSRIYFTESLSAMEGCAVVIEAIIEDLGIKQQVFQKLEELVSETCILATNTSSLSVTSIASACTHPARVIGMHFFNPPALMHLVEIIPALHTAPENLLRAQSLVEQWGKDGVVAKDTPGFIVNRVARPFYSEALRLYEEGFADFATIDHALTEIAGFRMGPFTLMDYIGNDVNYAVTESVFSAFYFDPRYKPAFTQKRLVEAGWLGKKSGRGYYDYATDVKRPVPETDPKKLQQIADRIMTMLMNEAADAVFFQIASPQGIDTAMQKGANYPIALLKTVDENGARSLVRAMDKLYDFYREDRYRCSPILRDFAKQKKTFY